MGAFGRRGGLGGGNRPAFGVAKPMQVTGAIQGGDQFPPVEPTPATSAEATPSGAVPHDAMSRLADRVAASGEAGVSKSEGFEASVHKIKEQVLPRLLERIDPEAASTLTKDELAEEFRPIVGEVLAELKITLNRREQFALEKVLVDELLGLGRSRNCLAIR